MGNQEHSRPKQPALALLFWVTAVVIAAFLPVALYVPYMLSGVSGANPSRSAAVRVICDSNCLGSSSERLIGEALAGYGGGGRLLLEFSATVSKELGVTRAVAGEPSGPLYVVVGGPAATAMGAAGLVTPSVSEAILRRPFGGQGSVVGDIVLHDPLVLLCNVGLLARAGLTVRPAAGQILDTWPEVVAVVQRLRAAKGSASGGAAPTLATTAGLFVPILHQNRGRLCDSSGEPLFQFVAGQAALRTLSALQGAAGDPQSTMVPNGATASQAFANGDLPMLIATRSFATDPSLTEIREGMCTLALPQTPGGPRSHGGSTVVLTCATGSVARPTTQTTSQFMELSARLASKLSAGAEEAPVVGTEWRPTASELDLLYRHGRMLESAVAEALSGASTPDDALADAARRVRWLRHPAAAGEVRQPVYP